MIKSFEILILTIILSNVILAIKGDAAYDENNSEPSISLESKKFSHFVLLFLNTIDT